MSGHRNSKRHAARSLAALLVTRVVPDAIAMLRDLYALRIGWQRGRYPAVNPMGGNALSDSVSKRPPA